MMHAKALFTSISCTHLYLLKRGPKLYKEIPEKKKKNKNLCIFIKVLRLPQRYQKSPRDYSHYGFEMILPSLSLTHTYTHTDK